MGFKEFPRPLFWINGGIFILIIFDKWFNDIHIYNAII